MSMLQERLAHIVATLEPLTEPERQAAREAARAAVAREIGQAPTWEDYAHRSVGEYPSWVTWLVSGVLILVMFAAGNVTVFRVFSAGRDHFERTMEAAQIAAPDWQAAVVGVAAFLMAEFMVVAAVTARRVYFHERRGGWWLWFPILAGLVMAFVGNWQITNPSDTWGWLETAVPPIAVLSMSMIGERLLLESIKTNHARKKLYEQALAEYEVELANVERHPKWRSKWANTLREAIYRANAQGRGRQEREELMRSLTRHEWSALVSREMQADEWFDDSALNPTMPAEAGQPQTMHSSNGSGKATKF